MKLIDVTPDLVVYRRFEYRYLLDYLSQNKMEFMPISSWIKTDSFEGLFHRLHIKSIDHSIVVNVINACDALYGQCWTVDSAIKDQWEHFSWKGKDIGEIRIKVKTTIKDICGLIDDTIISDEHDIIFDDRIIGRVKYKTDDEITDWLCSLGPFPIEKVQELSVQYALMKRIVNEKGINYTVEDEVRCLVWGESGNPEKLVFKLPDPGIFTEFEIDPYISTDLHNIVRNGLIKEGVAPDSIT